MAQTTISITITDSTVTLVDMRDTLCSRWLYNGDGTNADKVAFIKSKLIEYIRSEYANGKISSDVVTIQQNAQGASLT